MAFEDISPRPELPCRPERPPAGHVPWHVRVLSAVLRPVVLRLARRAYRQAESRLAEMCRSVRECNSREELEKLFGPPVYALPLLSKITPAL